jgi:hypothetical protein
MGMGHKNGAERTKTGPEPFRAPTPGVALLRVAEKHGLEGVVSKCRSAPNRSGRCRGWRKVKLVAWRGPLRHRMLQSEQHRAVKAAHEGLQSALACLQ